MRKLVLALALACVTAAAAAPVGAQDWPQRTIRIIVGFGPGGGTDIVGRIIAQALQQKLGQSVVVENRPGAGGTLGADMVARAAKDGYTLGILTNGHIITGVLNTSLPYDTLSAFEPVSLIATAGLAIVTRPDFPASNIKELIDAARASPGKITFASVGFGGTQHFAGELFMQVAGVRMLHVPYRTSPEAISAVFGKQVDVMFDTVTAVLGQIQAGRLKALAVTGKERFPAVPDVPAAIESGVMPGYDVTTWYGLFAPRGTPAAVVVRLNQALAEIITEASVRERLGTAGVIATASTPEAFGAHMASEFTRWNAVREAAGIPQQ
jgi:tripartite-type tricarboxylate transporter receptor subunit TctC